MLYEIEMRGLNGEEYMQLLEEHRQLKLSKQDWDLVLSLLENPPKPNAALLRAKQSHDSLISK